jgi:hypothetical protein
MPDVCGLRTRRHVDTDRVLELDLALLAQLHDEHRGELLGHRADAELGLRRVRDLPLDVGVADTLGEERHTAAGQKDGAAEAVHFRVRRQQLVDLLLENGRLERRLRGNDGCRRGRGLRGWSLRAQRRAQPDQ